jgi:hypothetical protein
MKFTHKKKVIKFNKKSVVFNLGMLLISYINFLNIFEVDNTLIGRARYVHGYTLDNRYFHFRQNSQEDKYPLSWL